MFRNIPLIKVILRSSLLFFISACSSTKVNLADGVGAGSFKTLAILPVEYPSEIQREKINAIRASLEVELKNSGYIVLADKLVREACSVPACPERSILANKYLVDGFVTLQVNSVSRANFLAGFVNNVAGILTVSDKNSQALITVKQNEAERGGVVFNSGQIIQGIISQAENTETASFERISYKFVQSIVAKLPRPKAQDINADAVAINLDNINIKQLKPEVFEICADATSNSLVSLVVNKKKANLREISPMKYCGVFLLDKSVEKGALLKIEARSPFGNSVRKEINSKQVMSVCNLEGNAVLRNLQGKTGLELRCIEINKRSPVIGDCNGQITHCPDHRFLIFKAPSALGPYERIAEIKETSWYDNKSSLSDKSADYRVVSVNQSGTWSLPVSVKPAS